MTSLKCRRSLVKIFLVGFLLLPYQWFYRQKKKSKSTQFSHIWQEFSTYPLVDCADTVKIRFWFYPSGKGHLFVSLLNWLVGCIKPTLDMPQLTKYQKSIMWLSLHGTFNICWPNECSNASLFPLPLKPQAGWNESPPKFCRLAVPSWASCLNPFSLLFLQMKQSEISLKFSWTLFCVWTWCHEAEWVISRWLTAQEMPGESSW